MLLMRALGDLLSDDAVISLDCGANPHFAARCLPLRTSQRFTGAGMPVSMAPGVSLAIAARLAYPDRFVMISETSSDILRRHFYQPFWESCAAGRSAAGCRWSE
jgi:thiamine pyrophosphate-dependent acetolactate synthase large subunit-like protein